MEGIVARQPEQFEAQLKLGRYRELRGALDDAARQVDVVLERVSTGSSLAQAELHQLLLNIGFGRDPVRNRQRLERLLDLLELVEQRASAAPCFDRARARMFLALEDRERFLESTKVASERWPTDEGLGRLSRLGERWMTLGREADSEKVFVIGLSRTGTTSVHQAL
ncbi:MAG: hypothetical protein P8P20_15695, partial [Acidimicrobiales bacterium]|nr:hypothetical protein [Acidimicrobiales bacterium]